MRTTIVFPPDLIRAAKARSAERGESLKALLTRAVEAELGRDRAASKARTRVGLPLFGSPSATPVRLSNADLARALAETDLTASPLSKTSRPARRRRRHR